LLMMILLANVLVQGRSQLHPKGWYMGTLLAIVAIWLLPAAQLNALPLLERGLIASTVYAIPVFFAGVIFSDTLRARHDVSAALGSNLFGAVLGGMMEYFSMIVGMRAIALLALCVYLGSLLASRRRTLAVAAGAA